MAVSRLLANTLIVQGALICRDFPLISDIRRSACLFAPQDIPEPLRVRRRDLCRRRVFGRRRGRPRGFESDLHFGRLQQMRLIPGRQMQESRHIATCENAPSDLLALHDPF